MKNISFDNPYLLLLIIPALLLVIVPFFITRNKDNKKAAWTVSLIIHAVIIVLVGLAAAGLSATTVLTKTTVYVLADVSYSSDRNLDEIDGYIADINAALPENSTLGVVCFGRECVMLTPAGRPIKSVSEAEVDKSSTDIVGALNYTEGLFPDDSLKRIVIITDGNDTMNQSRSTLASTVSRLTENGIKVDAIFLDNTLKEGENEVQLLDAEYAPSTYTGFANEASFLIQSSGNIDLILELYQREKAEEGEPEKEYKKIDSTVITTESGLSTVKMRLPSDISGSFDYKAVLVTEDDISPYNNTRTFTQMIVGKTKILLVTGDPADEYLVKTFYGENAEIDSYLINGSNGRVPFTLEDLIVYDEFVISNLDIRNIRNVNAFIDSLDMAISQYGKSLITLGDLSLQTNSEDTIFKKFAELLPVKFGNTDRDGRLYTIVLDVSHSMFMASKFTIAKDSAVKLLSILDENDYVCLVTFSGEVTVKTPKKVRDCKEELINYIDSLTTGHGTDIGMGLEEALKTVKALNLSENQIMLISDGFSFESERSAVDVSKELYEAGATVSAINTYIPAEGTNGRTLMRNVVNAGKGGKYYEISSPERVSDVVFGDMAKDVGDVIIEKDSSVKIARTKDGIVSGIASLPNISGYVLSLEKYDATVPLTVTYVKSNGYQETVPLYAYRSHGNGTVASFTSSLTGEWTKHWNAEDKSAFVKNLFISNTPDEREDHPFTLKLELTEYDAYVEIVPSILDPAAVTKIKITYPTGRTITRTLTFDSTKYFYTLETGLTGTYRISATYSYEEKVYTEEITFDIPYLPEYNAFASFDKFNVYEFMRGSGSTNVGSIPDLSNNKNEITTYKQSFIVPLLIAAISLFVIDVIVRKLRISKKKPAVKPRSA